MSDESNLTPLLCVDDFKLNQYYWCKFNCGWLIGRVNFTEIEEVADKSSWIITATSLNGAAEYKYSLVMALTVFTGGIIKADTP